MYLYMISWGVTFRLSTVCCWKERTNSANTVRILILVRKLSLEMFLAKDLGMHWRKLKEDIKSEKLFFKNKLKRYWKIITRVWLLHSFYLTFLATAGKVEFVSIARCDRWSTAIPRLSFLNWLLSSSFWTSFISTTSFTNSCLAWLKQNNAN